MDKNIILTGMRGSGKTEIGRRLAALMKLEFVDLDEEISKHEGMPIAEIVEKHGWPHFRKIEKELSKKFAQESGLVISTGGGTIVDPENEKQLKQNGFVVFLHCNIEILENRIKNCAERPSLTGKPALLELEEIWLKRKHRYEKSADLIFDTSSKKDIEIKANTLASLIRQIYNSAQ